MDAAPIGQRRRKSQEHQITAGHEGIWKPVVPHRNRDVAGQRGVGDRGQRRNLQGMAFAELAGPVRPQRFYAIKQTFAARELNGVTLSVVEAEHFDACKAFQRPCEASGGILST